MTDQTAEAADPTTLVVEDPEWGSTGHAEAFMLGRLLDVFKRRCQRLAEPFSKLKEAEQGAVLEGLKDDLSEAIKDAVQIIAQHGRVSFRAEVAQVNFKGPSDVVAQLKLANTPATHALADVAGGFVTVTIEALDDLLALPDGALEGDPDNRPLFDASTEGTALDAKAEGHA